jgi:methylmalonyl-CoA/ethylmalonyl-CoA epimerase
VGENEQVNTTFFKKEKPKLNWWKLYVPGSIANTFIEKRGEGLHHIAFEVDDIEAEVKRLVNNGFTVINEIPKRGSR